MESRNEVLREREEELKSRNLQLDTALRHMSQGLCMYDKGELVILCNERYATIYGLSPDVVKPGMSRREIIEMRIARGVWARPSAEAYLFDRTQPITTAGCIIQEMSDGRCIALTHVPMPGGGWVCTHEDITAQRQAQAQVEHLARYDGLTDLPNRVLLRERLHEALSRLRPGDGLAVHCLDLDRFKEVNDALGQAIGDELLQEFAARLRRAVSETDTLSHVGGDEFVIVQTDAVTPRDAIDLAAEIIAAMTEPFVLGDHFQVVLGASIGIAMAPCDGTDADELLKHANLALSRAKEEERGTYRFFETAMDARVRARHELERNLRSALTNGELDLAYQPLLNLKRNEISCFEALLRWRTPAGLVIEPSEFVPLAEETGLILPLGEWVLRQALAEAAKWPRHIRVAVNLSAVQFNARNLAQIVMSALAASGVEPSRLELEITESLLLQHRETTLATLHQLRDLGVRVALDDFGTGFSSLNYLRAFPFDKLKIDRCFIAGLAEGNEESLAIVRAVARLGRSLGIATTAEGVETREQMEIARKEGFTEIQGFWLSVPKNAGAIAEEYDLYRRTRKPRRAAAMSASPIAENVKLGPSVAAGANGKGGAASRKTRRVKPARSA
jgi:diguanylate cyclase (GGDEF)-like protein